MRFSLNQLMIIGVACVIMRHFEYKKIFSDNSYLNKVYKSIYRDVDQEIELVYKY